jgi:hypothetical protein
MRCCAAMAETLTIEPRFNGPPDSGNGGYTCGRLARFVEGPAAEVTLRLPPPIGRPLDVERDGGSGGAILRDGDTVVAEARPVELDAETPAPPNPAAAARAAAHSPFLDVANHPFPTCFVCGPKREPGDGLRIFAAPLAERDVFAAPWTPDPELAGADGVLPTEVVWAALDCPTSAPVANDWQAEGGFLPIVLARLTTRVLAPVETGREHTILAWRIALDGRKRHAGAALHSDSGELVAVARALWIELKPPSRS